MVLTDHIVPFRESSTVQPKDPARVSFQGEASSTPLISTWNLFRLALVTSSMLFVFLLSTIYSLNQASGVPSSKGGWLEMKQSPLHHVLIQDHSLSNDLKETDSGLLQRINDKATLELKTLVIAETVVPFEKREMLSDYVKQQLDGSEVISSEQKSAVMNMVNMAPIEGSINEEERGVGGSLRNSAVIALFKTYQKNIHFLLIGVRVEPRLGWRRISVRERNAWNDNLSRVLYNKIRAEAKTFVAYGTPTQLTERDL
ncbi:uncharacterized protein [Physcomitrium patens]|nr:uncharacterized protein LOC112292044 isoform X1 [Physcomitrium patens]|eukprot:XP_024395907.1 uncharacterized protein LOC112292044 isoform X1 [Physcomitrella patens]